MSETPGGQIKGRPLHFIWMCDCSLSMEGQKIEVLNFAIREAIPAMQAIAKLHDEAEILVRVVAFSDSARWHVSQPTRIEDFRWLDLQADGMTAMGEALSLVAAQLDVSKMPARGLPPVLVLISDGMPSDNFEQGLKRLISQGWGAKAVRVAIAIGGDADKAVLSRFASNSEGTVLEAHNSADLVKHIKFASTQVVSNSIRPPSQGGSPKPGSLSSGSAPTAVTAPNLVTSPTATAAPSGGAEDVW
ncbi:hypothetical protein CCAX7_62150 [Capsulimonas corticalis]|uniref:Uncharacterized protein n=1 Tax=Capsulimonas corticalis TaxID=2219043 RepID=A0A402CWH5_9BACT|nr:VWA domain-containing protein [Capsulimonas corticalis]BDI34164.1 hypothetical protein CCAX7_62150 [Capsulimonas corticalis]